MNDYSRRDFLKGGAGGLICGGCLSMLLCRADSSEKIQHKFLKDSGKNLQEVYDFAAQRLFSPRTSRIADYMGREKFIALMERAGDEIGANAAIEKTKALGSNSWTDFIAPYKERKPEDVPTHTFEITEETKNSLRITITECIWANAFKGTGAEDIGLAAICHPDFAYAYTFNPDIELIRTKTLMTGGDCCNHKWIYKG